MKLLGIRPWDEHGRPNVITDDNDKTKEIADNHNGSSNGNGNGISIAFEEPEATGAAPAGE